MDFGMSPGHIQDRYILGSRFSSVQFSTVQFSTVNSAQQLYTYFLNYLWCHFQSQSALQQEIKTVYYFMSLTIYSHETLDDNLPCDKTPKKNYNAFSATIKISEKRKPFLMFYMQRLLVRVASPIAAINHQSSRHHRN